MISSRWTHCGELVRRDLLLALGDGVEEQVFQAGQDARLPSPARRRGKHRQRVRCEESALMWCGGQSAARERREEGQGGGGREGGTASQRRRLEIK